MSSERETLARNSETQVRATFKMTSAHSRRDRGMARAIRRNIRRGQMKNKNRNVD